MSFCRVSDGRLMRHLAAGWDEWPEEIQKIKEKNGLIESFDPSLIGVNVWVAAIVFPIS